MNKAALYASIAMLPALAYAPLTLAQPESQTKSQAITEMKPLEKPLGVGDTMPAFVIDDASGGKLDLAKILEKGPVVLSFYRGSWCPYCVTELSEIQSRLETISGTGATVLAISPEKPSETVDLKRQKELGFLFGTDTDNRLAKKLALSFELDSETVEKYKEYGIDLPVSNDSDSWELPIPATYVINTDGTIKYAFVDEDYRKRANYDEVVMVLQKLKMEKKQSTRED